MFQNAYEVLDYLSKQCGIFEPVKREFERLNKKNIELKEQLGTCQQSIAEITALATTAIPTIQNNVEPITPTTETK